MCPSTKATRGSDGDRDASFGFGGDSGAWAVSLAASSVGFGGVAARVSAGLVSRGLGRGAWGWPCPHAEPRATINTAGSATAKQDRFGRKNRFNSMESPVFRQAAVAASWQRSAALGNRC